MVATAAPETPVIDRSACPSVRGHGTAHYYRRGCTCADAYADVVRHRRGLRYGDPTPALQLNPAGAARRLQAAAVAGWGLDAYVELTGITKTRLCLLRNGRPANIHRDRDLAIASATDTLLARPAPTGRAANRARLLAARNGWQPLDAWVDIDDPLDVPDAEFARDDAVLASDDLVELAEWHTTVDDAGAREVDHAAIAAVAGLTADEVAHRLRYARTGPRLADTVAGRVDAIRAEYRAAEPGTFNRTAVARRHDVRPDAVDRALRGSSRNGYPDLVAQLGPKWASGRRQGGQKLTDGQIHAVRAGYSAGDGYRRLAARHGIAMSLARRIVRGDIRPHLGLTDLTVQQGGHTPAATPTGRENRKGTAA